MEAKTKKNLDFSWRKKIPSYSIPLPQFKKDVIGSVQTNDSTATDHSTFANTSFKHFSLRACTKFKQEASLRALAWSR